MVSTRNKKAQESKKEKPLPKSAKAEKASADKKKSKAKQVKKEIKVEKKKEKVAAKANQKRQTPPQLEKESKKAKAKPKAAPQILGYTPDQYDRYKQLIIEYKGKTNDELKSILRKNDQKVSGTKDELAERIADGVVLGAIPKCPSCGGGRPKFDFKKGTYYCAGYRDDVDFVNCHKKYSLSDLPRNSWLL
ncbi:unnamed protein product [Blepharisma stoltei]|uniref:SAP domain-containing protein n=1 Tax=Blepharisma stoltei TaxID=1481888 RepID=A0AAU9J0Q0_9CILI|nr:unnamed protein product [Blepharisma stoltei]